LYFIEYIHNFSDNKKNIKGSMYIEINNDISIENVLYDYQSLTLLFGPFVNYNRLLTRIPKSLRIDDIITINNSHLLSSRNIFNTLII